MLFRLYKFVCISISIVQTQKRERSQLPPAAKSLASIGHGRRRTVAAPVSGVLRLAIEDRLEVPVGHEEGVGKGQVGDGTGAPPRGQPLHDGRSLVREAVWRERRGGGVKGTDDSQLI